MPQVDSEAMGEVSAVAAALQKKAASKKEAEKVWITFPLWSHVSF